MGPVGLEHPPQSSGETQIEGEGNAECNVTLDRQCTDERLQFLIAAWQELSEEDRQSIYRMVAGE